MLQSLDVRSYEALRKNLEHNENSDNESNE